MRRGLTGLRQAGCVCSGRAAVCSAGEVAGFQHCPVAGGMCGDAAAEVHPASAVLDEYQYAQSSQRHGLHVQEIDGEDPSGLTSQC
jgi:hypothetical protein